ncbi:MAG: tetratricopeptide repeat protein, partial [Simkaniaceae bacterium]|nr:tetratricopeptide repeat protein [Simkaniaceae bacterium]
MLKLLPIIKKFSKEVSRATKHFHCALWAVLFCSIPLIALSFSTDYPRSTIYRLTVGGSIGLGVLGVLSFLFWFSYKKIIERNKKKGKSWRNLAKAANLTLVKYAILPTCAVFMVKADLLSANQDDPMVQTSLGDYYWSAKKYKKAIEHYTLAANQGYTNAQLRLGYCYEHGNKDTPQDYNKAAHYYKLAADQDCADARFNLGVCYEDGLGVLQDYEKVIEHLALAADQGYAKAQIKLGHYYFFGKIVSQDYKEAVHYYTLAANQGDAAAQSNLGMCYEHEKGVPQDYKEAVHYYTLAANQG